MYIRSRHARRFTNGWAVMSALLLSAALGGCCKVPDSIVTYAADLPARADGQYASITDDGVKKSLVVKDASLQCKIDAAEKPGEATPACQCAKSSSSDWTADCKAWLGDHTPKRPSCPMVAPAASAAPPPPAPAPAPAASTPAAPG